MCFSRKIFLIVAFVATVVAGCAKDRLPPAPTDAPEVSLAPEYRIGPLDQLQVFVWRNEELTATVAVRPDGRISIPLVEDMQAAGKTPSELTTDIEDVLKTYVQDPTVTIIVNDFVGSFSQQVRVVGETTNPKALPYRAGMTLLDVMIAVGGLTEFADGDRSVLVRYVDGAEQSYSVRLDDLLRDGDISANVRVLPGDVIIIPEALF